MMPRNLIYGKHAVEEFINRHPKMIKQVWTSHYEELLQLQPNLDHQLVFNSTNQKMEEMFDQPVNHQGYVAEIKEFNYTPFNELLAEVIKKDQAIILVLDQIHDPYNFGAIIRSAVLLKVDYLVILDHKQVAVNPTVVKTSAGTAFDLQISRVNNLTNALTKLKESGFWIYASNLNQASLDARTVDFHQKSALIIGNEEKGIGEKITKNADVNVFLPSSQKIDSYNASVAAALLMFIISNQIKLI